MRKIICLVIALSLLTVGVSAQNKTDYWSFKFTEGSPRPTVMGGSTVPDKYGALYMGSADEKKIYLTFDAGYGNENVEKILDTLKKYDVKATFFILPGLIKYAPDTFTRMATDGHLIGNHSYSHGNMGLLSKEELCKELTDAESYVKEQTGYGLSPYFRPPQGAFTENTLKYCKELGYTPVFWSFAYADWDNQKQPDPKASLNKILSHLHNGEILLLHPNSATNAAILGDIIEGAKMKGFEFDTVDNIKQ